MWRKTKHIPDAVDSTDQARLLKLLAQPVPRLHIGLTESWPDHPRRL
jgi:hypothetical protein